jgi:hypothetical protein
MDRIKAISVKIQLAKNFPITNWVFVTGSVIKSSIVPDLLSSAHNLIPIAGIKIKNNQGCQAKKAVKSAWSLSKKRPRKKSYQMIKLKRPEEKLMLMEF